MKTCHKCGDYFNDHDKRSGKARLNCRRCSPTWTDVSAGAREKKLCKLARYRATKQSIPFTITPEDVKVPDFCPVFGIPLNTQRGMCGPNSPSLDRIVPELGYVPGNIVVISSRANTIKSSGSAGEHRRIADWLDSYSTLKRTVS